MTNLSRVPHVGDIIYVDTQLYLSHGRDDFHGGKATVSAVRIGSPGDAPFVEVVQDRGAYYNWAILAKQQADLAAKFGDTWAHPKPDLRPEFNVEDDYS